MLKNGKLSVDGISIALDDDSAEHCFVSHAHSDHTAAFSKPRTILASEETFAIMGKEPHPFPRAGVKLSHAGHMLGARQISADCESGKFTYTGDFSLTDSYTCRAAEILPCDTLMIDSTYCQPHMRMPGRWEVLSAMEKFVKAQSASNSITVFGAYTTGKTQELVCFLNRECGIAPIVNERAAKICSRYGKCGVRMDYLEAGSEEAEAAMRSTFVAIMPPHQVNFAFGAKLSEAHAKPVKTAMATGWAALHRFPTDVSFALSDHADFRDTMRYIHGSGAKAVICANSGADAAAHYLKRAGINAMTKEEAEEGFQTVLA